MTHQPQGSRHKKENKGGHQNQQQNQIKKDQNQSAPNEKPIVKP